MISVNTFKKNLGKYNNSYTIELTHSYTPRRQRYFSGFITNPVNNIMVYITTESCYNAHCENKMLVRYVKSRNDCIGGINHFCLPLNSAYFIDKLLQSPREYLHELGGK